MSFYIDGAQIGKISKLKYKTARETEHLYGAGDEPFDINPGNKAYTGEMELYKSVIDTMNVAAQAAGYDDLTDIAWVAVVNYKATATAPMQTVTLPNVQFEEFELGAANNDKKILSNIPFKCLKPIVL